jgi:DNA-binding MurR/RpiR family transcriptional regulator
MPKKAKIKKNETLIDYLETHFEQFSPTQKSLANYLLDNLNEAAFLTSDEMAGKIDTTPSTVVRFAQDIGFKGFPDLQNSLRKILITKVSTTGQFQQAEQFKISDKKDAIFSSLNKDLTNLNKLCESKNESQIKEFADIFASGKKKYIIASRSLYSLGHFFFFQVKKICSEVFFLTNFDGGVFDTIRELSPDDVLVGISFPRYNSTTVDFARSAKEKGTKIISITDSRVSPLYNISTICLFCPYESSAFFTSTIASLALLNAITSELFYRDYDSAMKKLEKEESILLTHNIVGVKGRRVKNVY